MSHNDDNAQRSARNHRPAIIGIAVALLVALVAYFVFMPGTNEQNEGIATTPPPAETPLTPAEGTAEAQAPETAAPEAAAQAPEAAPQTAPQTAPAAPSN